MRRWIPWCLGLFLACPVSGQGLQDLGQEIWASQFLEDGFALVDAPAYFDGFKGQLDHIQGFGALLDVQSRWVKGNFVVRSTDKNGNPLYGDPADGRIEGTAIRERMALMLGLGSVKALGLRFGVLFDYVIASHLDSWFEALGGGDVFTGGGKTGFSAYAFVSGPFVSLRILDFAEVSFLAWLKQRHPYDKTGAFLSTWVPDYTGTQDNSEGNTLDPWDVQEAGVGTYDGELYWPADRVPYRREFNQVWMFKLFGANYNMVVDYLGNLAAWQAGALLGKIIPGFGMERSGFDLGTGLEGVPPRYSFHRDQDSTSFLLRPMILIPLGKIPQILSAELDWSLSPFEFNSLALEYHLGGVPRGLEASEIALMAQQVPVTLTAGYNLFRWRDKETYHGWQLKLGADLQVIAVDLGFSYNYKSELKQALSRRGEVITEFRLRSKLGN